MKNLHSNLMKLHSNLYSDFVHLYNPTTKRYVKVACVKSKLKMAEVKGLTEKSLVIKIFKDDLFEAKLPLKGYEKTDVHYDGMNFSVKNESESNGSTKNLLILEIDRVS